MQPTPRREPSEKEKAFTAACDALGLKLSAVFVPWSRSRNATKGNPPKLAELNLNWTVTITRNGSAAVIETDFMQGIGHIPDMKTYTHICVDDFNEIERVCETGKFAAQLKNHPSKYGPPVHPLPVPTIADVLPCLLSDAEAIDARSLEDWARELGYDTDSRKAETIYNACLKIGLDLRRLLGDTNMVELRELAREL